MRFNTSLNVQKSILIDLRCWSWTGIGRVTHGIFACARELEGEFDIQYIVNANTHVPNDLPNLIKFRSLPFGFGEQIEFFNLFLKLRNHHVILHSLNFNVPIVRPPWVSQITHFYDVLTGTDEFRSPIYRLAYKVYVWSLRRNRSTILAQSDFTAKEIEKHHPFNEVIVCPHGFSNYIQPYDVDLNATYGLSRPYFLYIGLNKPRKNLGGLLKAYSDALKTDPSIIYDLVICGPIFDKTAMGLDIQSLIDKEPNLHGRVHLLGFIPEDHLYAMYRNASLYVVPSHFESGYSYPALEALAAGTPVLLNNFDMYNYASSHDEVFFFDGRVESGSSSLHQVMAEMLTRPYFSRIEPERCDVLSRFNWGSVKQSLKALYFSK